MTKIPDSPFPSPLGGSFALDKGQSAAQEKTLGTLENDAKALFFSQKPTLLFNSTITPSEKKIELDADPTGYKIDTSNLPSGISASPGATLSILITEFAAEQRAQNKNTIKAETESIAKQIESQANDLRDKAKLQLAAGIVSGLASIGSGVFSIVRSAQSMDLVKEAFKKHDNMTTAISKIIDGGKNIADTAINFAASQQDVQIKEKDAAIERMRSEVEALKSLDQSLSELISKTLSSSEAIQANMNQTRTKILG